MNPLRARDPDALATFYDGRGARVREYCASICPAALVEEAMLVAFVDFLGRIDTVGADADFDELLWKATRGSAAGRAEIVYVPASERRPFRRSVATEPGAICRAMPELLGAYASGELAADGQLERHLAACSLCRGTAARFREAEGALTREPKELPPEAVRARWLELALRDPARR